MAMRRATYFIPSDETDFASKVKVQKDQLLEVDGLRAAKHVRTKVQQKLPPNAGNINIEYLGAQEAVTRLPFDPPVKSGLHIYADSSADTSDVALILRNLGVDLINASPIESSEWQEWFDNYEESIRNISGATPTIKLNEVPAFRITIDSHASEITFETWDVEKILNDTEEPPTEVGIFAVTTSDQMQILSGRTRKLGTDEKSTPTMFRWYPKHVPFNSTAEISFEEPYGLHPELVISVDAEPPLPKCRLFAELYIPENLFLDQYQLDDLPRMSPTSELVALWGEKDLEKPVWQSDSGSIGLIHLVDTMNATHRVPFHTRYVNPTDEKKISGQLAAPFVFWACQNNDIDRIREQKDFMGIESIFPADDTSFHVWRSNSVNYRIPAIPQYPEKHVEQVTTAAVILGSLCILAAVLYNLFTRTRKMKKE